MKKNVQTWRDLIDDQIAELEQCERVSYPPGVSAPEQLLDAAQQRTRGEQDSMRVRRDLHPAGPHLTATVAIAPSQYSDHQQIERTIWLRRW